MDLGSNAVLREQRKQELLIYIFNTNRYYFMKHPDKTNRVYLKDKQNLVDTVAEVEIRGNQAYFYRLENLDSKWVFLTDSINEIIQS